MKRVILAVAIAGALAFAVREFPSLRREIKIWRM